MRTARSFRIYYAFAYNDAELLANSIEWNVEVLGVGIPRPTLGHLPRSEESRNQVRQYSKNEQVFPTMSEARAVALMISITGDVVHPRKCQRRPKCHPTMRNNLVEVRDM